RHSDVPARIRKSFHPALKPRIFRARTKEAFGGCWQRRRSRGVWSLINGAADLAAQYPLLSILIAFLAAIVEAVAVVGVLGPGTPILVGVAGGGGLGGGARGRAPLGGP